MENSFSPISFARPSVAATLPAVSEASDVASTPRISPCAAICWPFLSTRKTIFELESTCRRWRQSLICWYSSSYITRSGAAIHFHQFLPEGPAHISLRGDLLAVFIDQEDDFRVGVDLQTMEAIVCRSTPTR